MNTGSTPAVRYGYTELSPGQNNSRLMSMTYPNGRTLTYNYNYGLDSNISRLSSISDSSATLESYKYIGLDRFGRVIEQNWVNPVSGITTDDFQYGYDRDGNVLYKNNLVNAAASELYHASGAGYGYDLLNQLTGFVRGALSASTQGGPLDTVTSPSTTESWNLDALGNWSSVTTNGVTQNRTANQQNEVTSVGAQALSFDANGNTLVDDHGQHYTYDAWDRLVKVTTSGGTTLATYAYDALGRRIVENEGGVARDLYYSAAWQVLEERVAGVTKVQYVWSPVYVDALVERDRDADGNSGNGLEERLYVQQDANWNVTALVDTAGNVKERYIYDPYGQVTVLNATWTPLSGSAYASNYLYQGRRLDSVTGLYNFREREYSPTMGRWMQSDPLGFAAGDSNLYRTEGNNVTNGIDPSGLDASSRGTGPTGQTWDPLDSPSPSDMIARENEALKLQRRLDWMIEARKRSQSSLGKPGKDRSLEEWNLEIEIRLLRNPKYVRGSKGWQLTKRWQGRAKQDAARARALAEVAQAYYEYLMEKRKRGDKLTTDEVMWAEGYKEGGGNPFLRAPAQVGDIDPIEIIAGLGAGGLCRSAVRAPSSALPRLPSPRGSLLGRASDSRLRDAIANLYRRNAKVGSGSAMDAVRWEKATGQLLSPKGHVEKILGRRTQLMGLLGDPSVSETDRAIIKEILIDIQDALSMIR